MKYVDGYVLPVPKRNLKDYIRMARMGEKMWRKHGALDYKECVGDDLNTKWGTPFSRLIKLKPGETVVTDGQLQLTQGVKVVDRAEQPGPSSASSQEAARGKS